MSFKEISAQLNDGDNLTRFMGCLKKYNGGKEINRDFKLKTEEFFDYKWQNDKLQAFFGEKEKQLIENVPPNVLDTLLTSYLFNSLLSNFFHFFHIRRANNQKSSFYTWEDQPYRDFMFDLLTSLEPFFEKKYQILISELDEFNVI